MEKQEGFVPNQRLAGDSAAEPKNSAPLTAAAVLCALAMAACTVSDQDATDALMATGLTDVKLGGFSPFGCSDKDNFSREFVGTASNGQRVKGVVCSGVLKGATVRFTGRAQ